MATLFRREDATPLGLPGRASFEIVSGRKGARAVTLRLVEIPGPRAGDAPRTPHAHMDLEECIYVLSGAGTTWTETGEFPLKTGDTILLAAGERHVTRNTGDQPLVLLCFYPGADVISSMREGPA